MKIPRFVLLFVLSALGAFGSVVSQNSRIAYTLTTLPSTLPVTFPFNRTTGTPDLLVLDGGASNSTNSPPVILTYNSDYTVTGGGYNSQNQMQSGNITIVSTGTHSVAVGHVITIIRNVPFTQTTTFSTSGFMSPAMIEAGLDKLTLETQQLKDLFNLSLHFQTNEALSTQLVLSARESQVLGFTATGDISYSTGGGGGGGTTYTAGTGLILSGNEFSVNPSQSLSNLTVSSPISGSVTGNAATATRLATARAINGVNFDGTAGITVTAAANTLTGSSLAPSITSAPGLTDVSVGTLGTMAIQNANLVTISGGSITGTVVTGLAPPSAGTDATNKAYVDGIASGIVVRTACLVATTANITLSGTQTIDGVAVIATNRVLVKNQSTTSQNGIYACAAGAWSRTTDADTAGELLVGYTYFVSSGSAQASTSWTITTAPTTINSDPVIFTQFSGAQTYAAGTGLSLIGSTFNVLAAQPGITSLGTLTALAVSGTVSGAGFTNYFASPPALGGTTPAAVHATTLDTTGAIRMNAAGPMVLDANSGVALPGSFPAAVRQLVLYGDDANPSRFFQMAFNNAGVSMSGLVYGGTRASPTATADAIILNRMVGSSYDGSSVNNTSTVTLFTDGAQTGSNHGSKLRFDVTPNGSTTVTTGAMTLDGTGLRVMSNIAAGNFGAITFDTAAHERTTKQSLNLVVNVKDYGATGDGSTDDTAAINTAIAAITGHQTLFFPTGVYRITAGLTAFSSVGNVTIKGEGYGSVISSDAGASGANVFVINTTSAGFEICDLAITSTATVRGSGIFIRLGADHSSIHDCYFQASSDFAVLVSKNSGGWLQGASVINNVFDSTLGDGVHVGLAVDVIVANNRFQSTGDDSIGVVADDTTYVPQRVSITGNMIYNAGTTSGSAIRIAEGIDITCNDNSVYTSKESAIHVARYLSTTNFNTRIHIVGNKIYNSTTSAGPRGAIWIEYADQVSVMNNQVIDPVNGSGIAFLDCNDITIKGNFLRKCPSRSIATDDSTTANVRTSWTQVYITDNDIDWTVANEAIYVVPASGITLTNLMITGNTAHIVGGNWIYYARVTTGRIYNNTTTSAATVGNGGSVSGVTLGNNN